MHEKHAIVSPKIIFEEDIVRPLGQHQIQQNGIDLTLKSVSMVRGGGEGGLYIDGTVQPDMEPQCPILDSTSREVFMLSSGICYSFEFNESVSIPANMCAHIVARSGLVRNGGSIRSGWYDSGFEHPNIGAYFETAVGFPIELGARVAQIVFYWADAAHCYDGQYKEDRG